MFDLVGDILALLVKKAQGLGLIKGLNSHLVDGGLAILQYVDDTIFCVQDDVESAKNLKFILCLFEQVSGLKINFLKSEIFCIGSAGMRQGVYEEIFTCKVGDLPLKYLSIPVDRKKVKNLDWKRVEDKVEQKLSCWQGKLLSIGGGWC